MQIFVQIMLYMQCLKFNVLISILTIHIFFSTMTLNKWMNKWMNEENRGWKMRGDDRKGWDERGKQWIWLSSSLFLNIKHLN